MLGFRLAAQRPPERQRITDVVVMRFDHVYEVDPQLMTEHVQQQDIPAWDTQRIVDSRLGAPGLDARPLRRLGRLGRGAARGDRARGLRLEAHSRPRERL